MGVIPIPTVICILHYSPDERRYKSAFSVIPWISSTVFVSSEQFLSEDLMKKNTTYKSTNVHTIAAIGLFCAIAFVLCLVFHFKAAFLTFDLKDSVMTVGAMLLGPLPGLAMSIIVSLLDFMLIPSSTGTGIYGLLMDIISSASFVCIGSLIYTYRRTMKGALVGMLSSVVGMTAIMLLANILITPYYMGATTKEVIALIPTLLLPFNLTKAVFNAALVFILYNPISKAMRLAGFRSAGASQAEDGPTSVITAPKKNFKVTVAVTVIGVVVGVAALLYFFLVLNGSFSID